MQYKFPEITHIDDVLPIIEGRKEFIVADKVDYTVINYSISTPETFPDIRRNINGIWEFNCDATILRECRGLIFDKQGNLISRRLHKFFNVNERDETQQHKIDFSQPHVILEKLDGSMVTPIPLNGEIRWGTKMGITEVSANVEEFVKNNPQYEEFARLNIEGGFTTIFEWCSRKNRIIIDYPEDRLVLIAIRNNTSGFYIPIEYIENYMEFYEKNIEIVKQYPGNIESMESLLSETKDLEGSEGWVVRFNDGHMVKVKGDWYLRLHKTKDSLSLEKNVIDLIINEKIDDAKPFMLIEDRNRIEDFEIKFWNNIEETAIQFESYHTSNIILGIDRKRYSLEKMKEDNSKNPFASFIIFNLYNGKPAFQSIVELISKNIGSQTKVDEARILWGGLQWQ